MTDETIDPAEPTHVLLSRLFFAPNGSGASLGDPNMATADVIRSCMDRFMIGPPIDPIPFDRFIEGVRRELDIEDAYSIEGRSADWVTVWNVARQGTDRAVSLAFRLAHLPNHEFRLSR